MNIWIVNHNAIPPSLGGLVRHYYFSKFLQEKGHSVRIITSSKIHNTDINFNDGKSLCNEKFVDDIEYTFVKSGNYSGNGLSRVFNILFFPFNIYKALKMYHKNETPDVIYTSSPSLFVPLAAILFAKRKKIPVVMEVRDLWPESIVEYKNISQKNPFIQLLYSVEKWMYKKAERLVFTMPGGKEYLKDKHWDKEIGIDKVFHVNNGVDLAEFNRNKELYAFPDEDLDNEETFKVIYMGSIRLVNNIGQLVGAAEVLKKLGKDKIQILIYGDGTEKAALENECIEKGLHVKFKGRVEKKYVPHIISKADLNVINVMNTGLGTYGCSWNKLFEYIASEKPILCNAPQNYDLIRENGLGLSEVFKTNEDYAKGILRIFEMTESEKTEISNSANQLKKLYDYEYLTQQLEDILKGL